MKLFADLVKAIVTFMLMVAILVQPEQSAAQQTVSIESSIVEHSLEFLPADAGVVYDLSDSWGGLSHLEFDLADEAWLAVTSDGDVISGSIPSDVMDEYYSKNVPIPCFTSPWAAVGCGAAAAVTALVCEVRASLNIRRMSRACSSSGGAFSVTGVSGCGNVTGHCFQPNHHLQQP